MDVVGLKVRSSALCRVVGGVCALVRPLVPLGLCAGTAESTPV